MTELTSTCFGLPELSKVLLRICVVTAMFALSKQIACWYTSLGSSVSLQAPVLCGVESLPLHLVASSLGLWEYRYPAHVSETDTKCSWKLSHL
mgnify:CR=1 FL=1|jgi:hypothetical protein